jgi:hypothetical protein
MISAELSLLKASVADPTLTFRFGRVDSIDSLVVVYWPTDGISKAYNLRQTVPH